MSGVVSTVFGGNSRAVQGSAYAAPSDQETNRIGDIENQINQIFGDQSGTYQNSISSNQDVQKLFSDQIKSFIANGSQLTPEQIKQASDQVDQTFTAPAQAQLNQQLNDVQSNYNARAASMGRSPSQDLASQQAFASDATRAGLGLQVERGNRIQQSGLNSLQQGMQGTGFLNQLGQQAFQNRMGLLNARTGLADYYQKDRQNSNVAGTTSSPGLLGFVGAAGNAAGSIAKGAAGFGALSNGNFGSILGQK